MGNGRFGVSYALLANLLRLPDETEILTIAAQDETLSFIVEVEHPDIQDGGDYLCPTLERDYAGGKTEYAVKFVSWQ